MRKPDLRLLRQLGPAQAVSAIFLLRLLVLRLRMRFVPAPTFD
jgi:hypothetical protein